jgi:hypothetical protein
MKKSNPNVCPVCKKKITSEFKLYPLNRKDKTVCERCGRYCHSGCVVRVRDNYWSFSALEYSVCRKCYPKIEEEDTFNREIPEIAGTECYEDYFEANPITSKQSNDPSK